MTQKKSILITLETDVIKRFFRVDKDLILANFKFISMETISSNDKSGRKKIKSTKMLESKY